MNAHTQSIVALALVFAGCQGVPTGTSGEASAEADLIEPIGEGECAPRDLDCQGTVEGNAGERAEANRLRRGRRESKVEMHGGLSNGGRTFWSEYVDHDVGWFKVVITNLNGREYTIDRYVYDWGSKTWQMYFQRYIGPGNDDGWVRADYDIAARYVGRTNDAAFRRRVDGMTASVLTSEFGIRNITVLDAHSFDWDVGGACNNWCEGRAERVGLLVGGGTTLGCIAVGLLTVNPVAGIACEVVAFGAGWWASRDWSKTDQCWSRCRFCHQRAEEACKLALPGQKPHLEGDEQYCQGHPFECGGAGTVRVRRSE